MLLGRKQWISAKRWEQPRLDVCVMAGMGEHYGSNHFGARLPVGAKLVWIKRLDDAFGSFLSDAEEAWMKGGHGIYCKRDLSMNGETLTRQHPCQKPVPLMAWCMDKAKVPEGATVVDPYMGSGSTIIAAIRTGRKAIGFEIDPEHFEATTARIKNELAQGDLFLGHNAERTHGADNA